MSLPITTEPLAHVATDEEGGHRPHLLIDHLSKVARRAATYATAFDAADVAFAAGMLHDLGKYSPTFQNMIREANGFEAHLEARPGAPRDHSTAGAVYAATQLGPVGGPLAFCIAGHHAGLANRHDLLERIEEKAQLLQDALSAEPPRAVFDLPEMGSPSLGHGLEGNERARALEMWVRMLFSCLVDADFLDTESFYSQDRATLRAHDFTIEQLRDTLDAHMTELCSTASPSLVNEVRADILASCRTKAELPPGVFAMTVPTGGGKTLAAMDFALRHAAKNELGRVVVAIPYTSIIEQNADVYRAVFPEGALIEHHASLDPDDHRRETPFSRVASENWDAPIVVTTTVQLFESLFANRTSACRKLHRLANSVIILDEVQTVPPHLLAPILDGLKALVRDYGCSVVLSTATQPALARSRHLPSGLENVHELVPGDVRAFDRLRRVRVVWPDNAHAALPYEQLADELAQRDDCLAIVHLRDDARSLVELLDQKTGDNSTFHLSALMCPQHRTRVLDAVMKAKRADQPVRLVSTQLVEAGVDLDFPVVYRALSGLDSLAQAAGRCNREGKLEGLGTLKVFIAPTRPPPGVPVTACGVARGMLLASGDLDLFAPSVQHEYFQRLYATQDPDKRDIQTCREQLNFKETALLFKLIDDDWAAPVVVPWGQRARAGIEEIEQAGLSKRRLRKLQRFTVNVSAKTRDRWVAEGVVHVLEDAVHVLDPVWSESAYDERFGLVPALVGLASPGSMVV